MRCCGAVDSALRFRQLREPGCACGPGSRRTAATAGYVRTRRIGIGRKGDDLTCLISSRCSVWRRVRSMRSATGSTSPGRTSPTSTPPAIPDGRWCSARFRRSIRGARAAASTCQRWWRLAPRSSKRASDSNSRPRRAKARSPIISPSSKPDLGQPGASLDAALARFYNTYAALAQNPTSATARQQVIIEGQTLSRTFNDMSTSFNDAQTNADRELRDTVSQVNALAKQIADINAGIASAGPENADGLLDQQSVALASLTELADVTVTHNDDGTVDVSIGNGRALVVGATTFDLTATSTPPTGIRADHLRRRRGRRPTSRRRSPAAASAACCRCATSSCRTTSTQLDQLAYGVSTDVNSLTTSGYDLTGTAGVNFFAPPSGVAGAAQQMAVNSAVAADTSLVVASATTAAGNNDIARAIAALQDQPITRQHDAARRRLGQSRLQRGQRFAVGHPVEGQPRAGDAAAQEPARSDLAACRSTRKRPYCSSSSVPTKPTPSFSR